MGKHLRTINALPHKSMVRKLIKLIPGNLLGHESAHIALGQDLRHAPVVAEGIGREAHGAYEIEFFFGIS